LNVHGVGENLRINVSQDTIDLPPILPYFEKSIKGIYLENPTDYPICIYNADFDDKYRLEEDMLAAYSEYNPDFKLCEFPVRAVDEGTWEPVKNHWDKLQAKVAKKQQILDRRAEREKVYIAQADEKGMRKEDIMALERSKIFTQLVQDQKDGTEIPLVTSLRNMGWESDQPFDEGYIDVFAWVLQTEEEAAEHGGAPRFVPDPLLAYEEEDEDEGEHEGEDAPVIHTMRDLIQMAEKDLGLEADKFPHRVADTDRVNILIHGTERSGRTRLANEINNATHRGILNIDKAIDWALSGNAPKKLFDEKFLDRVRAHVAEKEALWENDPDGAKKDDLKAFANNPGVMMNINVPPTPVADPKAKAKAAPAPQASAGLGSMGLGEVLPPYDLPVEDVVEILKKRLMLCDFNTGFVLASLQENVHKYIAPEKVIPCLYALHEKMDIFLLAPSKMKFIEKPPEPGEEVTPAEPPPPEPKGKAKAKAAPAPVVEEKPKEDEKPKEMIEVEICPVPELPEGEEEPEEEKEARLIKKFEEGLKIFYDYRVAELQGEIGTMKKEIQKLEEESAAAKVAQEEAEAAAAAKAAEAEAAAANPAAAAAAAPASPDKKTPSMRGSRKSEEPAVIDWEAEEQRRKDEIEMLQDQITAKEEEVVKIQGLDLAKNRAFYQFYEKMLEEQAKVINEEKVRAAIEAERQRAATAASSPKGKRGKGGGKGSGGSLVMSTPPQVAMSQQMSQQAGTLPPDPSKVENTMQSTVSSGQFPTIQDPMGATESMRSVDQQQMMVRTASQIFRDVHAGHPVDDRDMSVLMSHLGVFLKVAEFVLPRNPEEVGKPGRICDLLLPCKIPEEPPLPDASYTQIVFQPRIGRDFGMDEQYSRSIHNFSILTPLDSVAEPIEAEGGVPGVTLAPSAAELIEAKPEGDETAPKEGDADLEGEEGTAEVVPAVPLTDEEMLDLSQTTEQTRWILPPHSRRKIFVKFFSSKIEKVTGRLHFEVLMGYNYLHNDPDLLKEQKKQAEKIKESNLALLMPQEFAQDSPPKQGGTTKKADTFEMPFPPVMIYRRIVTITGQTAFPHVNKNPSNMFMRRIRNRPQHPIYPARQFIMTEGKYDFGPLLVGKDPESRNLYDSYLLALPKRNQMLLDKQITEREQTGYAFYPPPGVAVGNTPNTTTSNMGQPTPDDGEYDDLKDLPPAERLAAINERKILAREKENQMFFLRKHVECFRITNNCLFPLKAHFTLASSKDAANQGGILKVGEQVKKAKDAIAAGTGYEDLVPNKETVFPFPLADFNTSPFVVIPDTLELQRDETKDITIWCFPTQEGKVEDKLVCTVENNPESVVVPIQAVGSIPKVGLFWVVIGFWTLISKLNAMSGCKIYTISEEQKTQKSFSGRSCATRFRF